jgi:DNA-binding transcriptional ArsR family regulator
MYVKTLNANFKKCILVLLFLSFFFYCFSTTTASSDGELFTSHQPVISSYETNKQITDFNDLFNSIIGDENLKSDTILLNGTTNDIIELPKESIVVQLPEQRIGIKYTDKEISVLPDGTRITYYDNNILLNIPDQISLLKTSELVIFPIENFTASAIYDQSIDKLESYEVKIMLHELNNPALLDNTEKYSVSWGDGTTESYSPNQTTVTHTYKKSGTYHLTFTVSDDFGFAYEISEPYTINYEGHLKHTYFLIDANKEPIAVTTASSISFLALGFIALTETGKYKFLALLPLLIPLYTRIQKEDVLDQFVRGQIYGYIKTNPGVHYNQIRRGIDVKNGTLSYHLRVLEKTELIKSRREGLRYRAFYPTGMKFPKKERFRLTELQIDIVNTIKQYPSISQKTIAKKLGKKPQTINYNIKVLEQAGIIEVKKKGRKTSCSYVEEDSEYSSSAAE